ncbi:MAG: hypothetical protein ACXWLM_02360 [Myxococcales bacterium]
MNKTLMVLAAAILAACGSQEIKPGLQADGTVQAELLLKGATPGGYTTVLLDVGDVKVMADGVALPLVFSTRRPNLAAGGTSPVATFRVPKGAQNIDVTVRLDDFGGFVYGGDLAPRGSGMIDARNQVVHFTAKAAWLYDRGHAVVVFDLARSLQPMAAERLAFLANAQIQY